jgi:signal transduction histidine kinase
MSLAQYIPGKLLAGVLPKSLPLSLIISVLLLSTLWARAAEPLGATPHSDGSTTFRVWAPFVDAVAVTINGGTAVPLASEDGHPDPADTTWVGTVPGASAGDKYRYAIRRDGVTREFNDPRARQLTGFEPPDGFGLEGNDDKPQSVVVDPHFTMPAFTEPTFNTIVIYEMHIGTFNNTFAGAVEKLDYLKDLGINAVEVLPITQNPLFSDHTPPDHDWGYDPVQLYAVKSKYGTPQEFKEFVKQCHQRQIAVIVDVVYNHVVENNLLKEFGGFNRPEIPGGIYLYGCDRANTGFGPRPDYGRPQVRQYVIDNALQLLRAVLAQRRERAARLMTGDAVAATIAHEVRQPLSGMITNADAGLRWLDRSMPDLDEAKAAFKQIVADGHRAGAVIGSIRAIFKKDARNRTSLDINDLIGEALALTRGDLQRHRILVQPEPDAQLPQVRGNRIQLQQVLLNLITNAIDSMAAKDGARVLCVRSEVDDGGGVIVSVADTGAGIGSQDLERIFNPLFTTKSSGMGMGLSICRSIIEAHDGRLWVVPNKPEGAVFQFMLVADGAASAGASQGERPDDLPHSSPLLMLMR